MKKNNETLKIIGVVLAAAAAALAGPPAVNSAVDSFNRVAPPIEITGPRAAEVGQLIELSVTGANPCWLPQTDDCHVDGNSCFVSFRAPGSYEVIASSLIDGKTQIAKQTVVVGEAVPKPGSVPVPKPGPEPTPDVVPNTSTLSNLVVAWCTESDAPRDTAGTLGKNFLDAAENSTDVDDLLARISQTNRKVDQSGFERALAKIQQHLIDNLSGGDLAAHQTAFSEIGEGLIRYSETTTTNRELWSYAEILK